MFNRIVRLFLSRKFAVYLLIVMVAFLVLGTSLPDINSMSVGESETLRSSKPFLFKVCKTLQMQNLISSPYFLILPALIFLSTVLCTIKRLGLRVKKEGGFYKEASCETGLKLEEISSILSCERWRVVREGGTLNAVKGGHGFHGSVLFHSGLLVIFVAVVVSSVTQFSAELLLTERFPVKLGEDAFVKIYKRNGLTMIPPAVVEMTRFIPSYDKGRFAKDFAAELLIDGTRKDVHVNRPITIGDFQLSLHRYGFCPSFRIIDETGREILNAAINLVVVGGKKDSFVIPGTPYTVNAEFFPDFFSDGGMIGSRGVLPKNPTFSLKVLSQGRELGKGLVRLGDRAKIGGLDIEFDGLNYWADMIVGRDYGLWLFEIGFTIGVLGLAMRFAFPDKKLEVILDHDRVYVQGWTKYFPDFFEEELRRIVEKLRTQGLS